MSRSLRAVRRLAGAGAVLGVVAAVAVVAPMAASAAPSASFTSVDDAAIGPGVQISTPLPDGAELCTANFVFANPDGAVYLGTAAHCMAGAKAGTSVDGCTEPVQDEGIPVSILGRDRKTYTGTVAYNSWVAMHAEHETDPSLCTLNDFALVELDPGDVGRTSPTVPGLGGPTALNTDGTPEGQRVFAYQPNETPATPAKQGVSLGQPDGPRTHVVSTVPPGVPGDSGSGYLDSDGRAFGSLSSLMTPTNTNGVADIAQALDYAAEHGSVGRVSLVDGGRPFSATGLPATEAPSGPALPALPLPRLVPVPLG